MEDPDYLNRLSILALIMVVFVLLVYWVDSAAKVAEKPYQSLTQCFYEAPRIPYYPEIQVLATEFEITKNLDFDKVLECLIRLESSGNPKAYNPKDTDGLPAIGLLQFKAGTFKMFCVDRYGFEDDIWNPNIQTFCAKRMIENGLVWHWGTASQCI